MKIIINGTEFRTTAHSYTYYELLDLAQQPDESTITYRVKGKNGWEKSGILGFGQSLELIDGMIVNVCHTGNA